jgi:hypothetical protein
MKITFGGTAIAGKNQDAFAFSANAPRKGEAVGYAKLCAEVRNHAKNSVLTGPKMKGTIAALGVATGPTLKLRKKLN